MPRPDSTIDFSRSSNLTSPLCWGCDIGSSLCIAEAVALEEGCSGAAELGLGVEACGVALLANACLVTGFVILLDGYSHRAAAGWETWEGETEQLIWESRQTYVCFSM